MQQQQINLYQPVETSRSEPFSSMMMLTIVLVTIALMLVFYGVLFVQERNLQTEITALKTQLEQTAVTVDKLEMTIGSITDVVQEQQQLKRFKQLLSGKQSALNELSSMVKGNNRGMSDYFSALAKKNIEAIWFSQIDIYSGGQQIVLKGQTADAKYLPNFILSLKEEAVFNGVNFKLFNAQRNEDDEALNFMLQTEINQVE